MVELPGIHLTAEQQAILNVCPPPNNNSENGSDKKGQLTRITAAAGAGKTTTLLALALKAIEQGHRHITYVTFTKAAASDGQLRILKALGQRGDVITVDACTLHACAHRLLSQSNNNMWQEKHVKNWISTEWDEAIECFLQPCYRKINRGGTESSEKNDKRRRAREQVEFFIYKSLRQFCQRSWTRAEYGDSTTRMRDYYPAKKFHGQKGRGREMGFSLTYYGQRVSWYADLACRMWDKIIEEDIRSYDIEMKRAQLEGLEIPGTILLVDESQDMDACQVDWVARQQVEVGTHVFVVGDPAQAIYGFRGAKSQYLMDLPSDVDLKLTESWRFGPSIARMANLPLYAKDKSGQTGFTWDGRMKNWIPYRVRAACPKEDRVTDKKILPTWSSRKITLIARSNAQLMMEILQLLGFGGPEETDDSSEQQYVEDYSVEKGETTDDSKEASDAEDDELESENENDDHLASTLKDLPKDFPKVHINGRGESSGIKAWKKMLKEVQSVFDLYMSTRDERSGTTMELPRQTFPDFGDRAITWRIFCEECEDKELTKYNIVLGVVSRYKEKTMDAVQVFKREVVDRKFSAEEADIIVSTCHTAKGMEWDHVQVCDDFIDLCQYKAEEKSKLGRFASPAKRQCIHPDWKFGFQDWGDDVNLLYVACTRAKKLLSVPAKVVGLLNDFDEIHTWKLANAGSYSVFAGNIDISGIDRKLDAEDTLQLYKSLVLPLREEVGLRPNQLLADTLLQPLPETAVAGLDTAFDCPDLMVSSTARLTPIVTPEKSTACSESEGASREDGYASQEQRRAEGPPVARLFPTESVESNELQEEALDRYQDHESSAVSNKYEVAETKRLAPAQIQRKESIDDQPPAKRQTTLDRYFSSSSGKNE